MSGSPWISAWFSPGIYPSFHTPAWISLSVSPAFIFHLYPSDSQTCESKWSDSNGRFSVEAHLGHCFVNSNYIFSLWATPHISWNSSWAFIVPIHSVNSIDRHTGRQIDSRMKRTEQISDASILREIWRYDSKLLNYSYNNFIYRIIRNVCQVATLHFSE